MRMGIKLAFLMCMSVISFAIVFNFLSKDEPLFSLRGIKISGCFQTSERDILKIVTPKLGTTILNVDTEMIRHAILGHPYVKDVRIKRVYPFYLHIEVKERTPAAIWVREDGTLKIVDDEGCVYRDIMRNEKVELFLIHAGCEDEVKRVVRLVSKWIHEGLITRDFISEVAHREGGIRIMSKENVEIILGKEEFDKRIKKAKKVLEDAKNRGLLIRCIDARFEKGAIIREKGEG